MATSALRRKWTHDATEGACEFRVFQIKGQGLNCSNSEAFKLTWKEVLLLEAEKEVVDTFSSLETLLNNTK